MCCKSQGPAWRQPVKFLTGEEGAHLWRERVSLASLASPHLLPAPPLLWQPSVASRPHSAPVAQLQRLPCRAVPSQRHFHSDSKETCRPRPVCSRRRGMRSIAAQRQAGAGPAKRHVTHARCHLERHRHLISTSDTRSG